VKDESWPLIFKGFIIGIQFDSIVSCYLLSAPFLLFALHSFINFTFIFRFGRFILLTLYSTAIIIQAIDIPFFNYFDTRLHTGIFLWINDLGFSIKMILQEPTFYIYLIPLISILLLFFYVERKFFLNLSLQTALKPQHSLIAWIVVTSILVLGMRGRLAEKSPVRIGTSYYCNNPLLNKLGLNPAYSFAYSMINDYITDYKSIHLIDEATALSYVRKTLNSNDSIGISRYEKRNGTPIKRNVVLVIMESMCEIYRGKYDGPKNKTPYINELEQNSISFNETYSSGIHTFNGVYSTLYSMPAIYKQHPFELYMDLPHYAMPQVLVENDYRTLYFTTHDSEFDNIGGFLMAHGFQKVISESDYPSEEIKSTMGIPDHYLFEHVIQELETIPPKPFFATIMTGSLHKPYIIPENIPFKPQSEKLDEQIIEYADWSIHYFIELAKKKPWINNTIFVFVADHGHAYGHTYEMPLSGNRIPFFIYAPSIVKPERRNQLASQIDVGPTLLNLLNLEYENNTLGIDLFTQTRSSVYFSADNRIGCLDSSYYWFQRSDGQSSLYRYKNLDKKDYIASNPKEAVSLKTEATCMLQAAQYLYKHKLLQKHRKNSQPHL